MAQSSPKEPVYSSPRRLWDPCSAATWSVHKHAPSHEPLLTRQNSKLLYTQGWVESAGFPDGAGSSSSTGLLPCQWLYGVRTSSVSHTYPQPPRECTTDSPRWPGYYALPDLPSTTRVRWLKPEEKELALERMRRAGKQLEEPFTMQGLKRVLKKWHFWVYTTYYT